MKELKYQGTVKRWDMFEVALEGPKEGNPFTEQEVRAEFCGDQETVSCDGFYDGEGIYRVRFMPSFEGEYSFTVCSSFGEEQRGAFRVEAPDEGCHGPVRVADTWHFAYEDGTPYYSVGTTCYVWHLQSAQRQRETLETLEKSVFNKIRFCIFPKHYDYNLGEPQGYPYEGTPVDSSKINSENFWDYTGGSEGNHWDFTRFCPQYFQHIDRCIEKLQGLGIEADLIIMHPYDRWGFSRMSKEADTLYYNYIIARFSAYRNVWWSLANEYDLMPQKSLEDWEGYAAILGEKDPYHHLRSIHNCMNLYDFQRPWITHCSVQRIDLYKSAETVSELRQRFRKPVVMDEMGYEGDIQHGWGNLTGEEMVRRFWEAACRGGYPGHGETYLNKESLWWSHGGKLYGESHKRFAFLLEIMKETPGGGLKPWERGSWDEVCGVPQRSLKMTGDAEDYYLFYYSFMRPSFREFYFDEESRWQVRVLDTWNMTIEDRGIFQGKFRVGLPARAYMAVQIRRVS